jgi:subtilisin family serine protease
MSTDRRPTPQPHCPDFCEALEPRRLLSAAAASWGPVPQLIGQDKAAAAYPNAVGSGESIAILDTGIDYKLPELGGGFGPGHKVVAGYDFVSNDADPMDPDGHGTAVASIAAASPYFYNGQRYQGVAPSANLIALRIDDGIHNPPAKRIAEALQWVIDHRDQYNIVSVNISEGIGKFAKKTVNAGFGDKLATLAARGVFVAAASGNDGYPGAVEDIAADPHVAAVGSVTAWNQMSPFSDSGAALDLLAPGQDVPLIYLNNAGQEIYAPGTGTSFAAPFAAGAAALIHQVTPSLSPASILALLKQTGDPTTDPRNGGTFARLNLYNALSAVMPRATAVPVPTTPTPTSPAPSRKQKQPKAKAAAANPKPAKAAAATQGGAHTGADR